MAYTTRGFPYPTNTGLVKDGAQNFNDLATTVDSKMGLYLIKTQALTAGSSTATVSSVFTADFNAYKIIITNGTLSGVSNIPMKLGSTAANYYSSRIYNAPNNGTVLGNGVNAGSDWSYAAQGGANGINCNIDLINPYLSRRTSYSATYLFAEGAASELGTTSGFLADTTSYTAFTLITTGGQTFQTGTIRVYGYNNG